MSKMPAYLKLHTLRFGGKSISVFTADEAGVAALQARLDQEDNDGFKQLAMPLLPDWMKDDKKKQKGDAKC
jgi:hypothetical protein